MKLLKRHEPVHEGWLEWLIREYPLALLIPQSAASRATPLPLLLENGCRRGGTVLGHLARANPNHDLLLQDGRALAVFLGPNGYISPRFMEDRSQAPTWNYTTVQLQLAVTIRDDPAFTLMTVERLAAQLERGADIPWRVSDLGQRRDRLLTAIVGFEAEIIDIQAQFRLSQHEPADITDRITHHLDSNGEHALATAIRDAAADWRNTGT